MKNSFRNFLVLCGLAVLLAAPRVAAAHEANCVSINRDNFDRACHAWTKVMDKHGWADIHTHSVKHSDMCDYSNNFGCHDRANGYGIDGADVTLIATHGGGGLETETRFTMASADATLGNGGGTQLSAAKMLLDDQADYVQLFSCAGIQYTERYLSYWRSRTNGLHQLHGYHGAASTGMWDHLDDMAEDAFDGSVAWSWLENMTVFGKDYDRCAMTLLWGSSANNAYWRRDRETYANHGSYSDPTGASRVGASMYYCNCNPPDGENLRCD